VLAGCSGPGGRGAPGASEARSLGCPALFDGGEPLADNRSPPWREISNREDVYLLTSDDAVRWTLAEPAPLLHSFTSLGLWIDGDQLYLLGNTLISAPLHPTVTALRTSDLRSWRGCAWPVTDSAHRGLVDAQPVRGPAGGIELMYYAFPRAEASIDPAILPGEHEIWRAVPDRQWLRAAGPAFGLEYLTDPTTAYAGGRWLLAGTQRGTRIVFASSSDGETFQLEDQQIKGASVPHLQLVDDELWLIAQRSDLRSRTPQPYLFTSDDGSHWEPRRFLLGEAAGACGCSSPVAGRFKDRYVLFCVRPAGDAPCAGPALQGAPGPGQEGSEPVSSGP